jgi:hypothetical protein
VQSNLLRLHPLYFLRVSPCLVFHPAFVSQPSTSELQGRGSDIHSAIYFLHVSAFAVKPSTKKVKISDQNTHHPTLEANA